MNICMHVCIYIYIYTYIHTYIYIFENILTLVKHHLLDGHFLWVLEFMCRK